MIGVASTADCMKAGLAMISVGVSLQRNQTVVELGFQMSDDFNLESSVES